MEVKMKFKSVYAYRYSHGNVIVYGEDKNGHGMYMTYMMYDSLADVKRHLKSQGVKNVSHMRKWMW